MQFTITLFFRQSQNQQYFKDGLIYSNYYYFICVVQNMTCDFKTRQTA